jgi:hypothetical protein
MRRQRVKIGRACSGADARSWTTFLATSGVMQSPEEEIRRERDQAACDGGQGNREGTSASTFRVGLADLEATSICDSCGVWFLGLYGLLELIPGLIHFLLPDGGAGVIAGLGVPIERWQGGWHGSNLAPLVMAGFTALPTAISDFPAVAEVGHPHQPSAVEFALGCEWPAVDTKKADGHRKRF